MIESNSVSHNDYKKNRNARIKSPFCVTNHVNNLCVFYLTLGALTDFTNKAAHAHHVTH